MTCAEAIPQGAVWFGVIFEAAAKPPHTLARAVIATNLFGIGAILIACDSTACRVLNGRKNGVASFRDAMMPILKRVSDVSHFTYISRLSASIRSPRAR